MKRFLTMLFVVIILLPMVLSFSVSAMDSASYDGIEGYNKYIEMDPSWTERHITLEKASIFGEFLRLSFFPSPMEYRYYYLVKTADGIILNIGISESKDISQLSMHTVVSNRYIGTDLSHLTSDQVGTESSGVYSASILLDGIEYRYKNAELSSFAFISKNRYFWISRFEGNFESVSENDLLGKLLSTDKNVRAEGIRQLEETFGELTPIKRSHFKLTWENLPSFLLIFVLPAISVLLIVVLVVMMLYKRVVIRKRNKTQISDSEPAKQTE